MGTNKALCVFFSAAFYCAFAAFAAAQTIPSVSVPAIPPITLPAVPSPPAPPSPPAAGYSGNTSAEAEAAPKKASPKASSLPSSAEGLLSGAGLFGGLESLLGIEGALPKQSDDAALLRLVELMEKQQAELEDARRSEAPAKADSGATPAGSGAQRPERACLERLSIGGRDYLQALSSHVSSAPAKSGSFLVSAERRLSGGAGSMEIVYFVCKPHASRSETGDEKWSLFVDVAQADSNSPSIFWTLAQESPLDGVQYGDLIVFRRAKADAADVKPAIDIAIRLPSSTVP
ncbi:hypothetical protein K7J14_06280 [Treponema zuelzerae]|uniref:Uncharacterized protein n=1 Tax=Teretinema zuelzerae TaxID=156 RepID=A0AAE3JJJ5_9SPIR|nr:hypothetical protein [Teretinema zuelzerae]MCD1654310.1 hypothetical protein [Teretinema zuelzerae]